MSFRTLPRQRFILILSSSLLALVTTAMAQPSGLLYDPQPPANSAYVRVVNVSADGEIDVEVDGKRRIAGLAATTASDYLVLPAGRRNFSFARSRKGGGVASMPVEVIAGRAMTVAIGEPRPEAKPWIFEDRANTNKLKAVLAVYHLDSRGAPVDVLTADGSTRVVSALKAGTSSSLPVNPVTIELIAAAAGTTAALASTTLAMRPGGTYSVLLFPGESGKMSARSVQNKVERYTDR